MFKNRSFNVKLVKDSDQEKKDHPVPFDATDVRMTIEEVCKSLAALYIVCKAAQTVSGVITHVVVTKVGPPVIIEAVQDN